MREKKAPNSVTSYGQTNGNIYLYVYVSLSLSLSISLSLPLTHTHLSFSFSPSISVSHTQLKKRHEDEKTRLEQLYLKEQAGRREDQVSVMYITVYVCILLYT